MAIRARKALVTGGAGFIGSHVVDALIEDGYQVTVIDDLSQGRRRNLHPKASFVRATIAHPRVEEWIRSIRPELIVHAAAHRDVRRSVIDPVFDAKTNIFGTLYILRAAAELKQCQCVFLSTGGAMFSDPKGVPYQETDDARPLSPYGISKLAGERYVDFFASTYGVPAVTLRLPNIYGPRQDASAEGGVIAIFIEKLLNRQTMTVFGDGEQTRDYLFVADVVSAVRRVVEQGATGLFHLGTGKETSVNHLIETLAALSEQKAKVRFIPEKQGEVRRSSLSAERAKKELGWKPQTRLEDGLRETFEWFSEYES